MNVLEQEFMRITSELLVCQRKQEASIRAAHLETNEWMAGWALDEWHQEEKKVPELRQKGI